ncbi:MAG: hypothetical protein JNM17_18345, partial [Archangium sp.]|nr:hypothetical protein [Archangium sp.]
MASPRGALRSVLLLSILAATAFGQETDFPAEVEGESDPAFVRLVNPAFPAPPPDAPVVDQISRQVGWGDRGPVFERADLAPYFTEGRAAEAKALFDAGSYTKAVAALDGVPDTAPIRFLRALAAQRSGDQVFAAKEFESLAGTYTQLRDRCLVHAGWSYEQQRDWPSAIRVFSQVSPTSRQTPDGRIGLARAYRWQREFKKAFEAINEYLERPAPPWGRDVGAEALLVAADLHGAKKDAKKETEALEKLWSRHPLSREAIKAEPRLGDLTLMTTEVMVARAEALIEAHRNKEGVAIVEPMITPPEGSTATPLKLPEPIACRAQFALGKGYRKLRQHAKAVTALAPLKKCKDPELRARAFFTLGFSQTFSTPGLASGTYEGIANAWPEHPLADDSLFF